MDEHHTRVVARPPVQVPGGTASRVFAAIVCSPFRYFILAVWIGIAVFTLLHPLVSDSGQTESGALPVPNDAPPLQVEKRSAQLFPLPVLSRAIVVQRSPTGLPVGAQKRAVTRALRISSRRLRHELPGVVAALPLLNTRRILPGSLESGTTALTYLFFDPRMQPRDYDRLAETFITKNIKRPGDHPIGATGFAPGWARQGDLVGSSLRKIEVATVVLIFIIVALTFRSFIAPLLTLLMAGTAYILGERGVAMLAEYQKAAIPVELKPLLVVLILAICTDYAIFYLSSFRHRLASGDRPVPAAMAATSQVAPIILVAGLTIAACTGCLLLGHLEFLRVLGPALAVSVLVALVISITFMPAAMASFGRFTLWPHIPRVRRGTEAPGRLRRWVTWRPLALLTAVAAIAALIYMAGSISRLSVGLGLLDGLPGNLPEAQAYAAEQQGFAPGYLSPTLLLLEGRGLGAERARVRRFEALVSRQHGVAATLGPREQPFKTRLHLVYAKGGNAARIVVIFNHDPFGGTAISDLDAIETRLPSLLRQAGLSGVRVGVAGDTALVKYIVDGIYASILPIAIAIGAIVFLLLAALLRSLVAPVYLLAASALAVLAPLGLTVLVFQEWMHHESLAYYVPVGAGVLLFALGSDYNLFLVGRIWDEAKERPLREAIAVAGRQATRTIGVAAITLAASFALLFIIPLTSFREFAFAMTAGVLIDAFVVRSYLVPALIAVVGKLSMYPGRMGKRDETAAAEAAS